MKLETNPEKWIVLEQIESTNTFALNNKGLSSGSVIIAKKQTAGRGRMGKHWYSIPGNSLLFSGLLHVNLSDIPVERLRYLSIMTGLSVINACEFILEKIGHSHSERGELSLKWPNDVCMTVAGKTGKLAGILIETEQVNRELLRCVVGIGLNWKGDSPELYGETMDSISLLSESDLNAMEIVYPLVNNFNDLFEKYIFRNDSSVSEIIRSRFFLKDKIISLSDGRYRVIGMNDDGGLFLKSLKEDKEKILYDTSEKIIVETVREGRS